MSGTTVGGLSLYSADNLLDRTTALRLYSEGSAWFSGDGGKKGRIAVGQLADLAVLSADFFTVPAEEISGIESLLTVMGGRVVHGAGEFGSLAPPLPPVSPDWAPTGVYGGAYRPNNGGLLADNAGEARSGSAPFHGHTHRVSGEHGDWGIGCSCFAF